MLSSCSVPNPSNKRFFSALRYLVWMALLLLMIFFVPHADAEGRKAFHQVVLTSAWGDFAEWPAVWASLVVILLGCCVFYLIRSVDELLPVIRREHFTAEIFFVLMILPILLLGVGVYLLTKALF
jgi:hypothetical protein